MVDSLPPGPRMASVLQTIGWWSRPTAFLERCRARYGKRFTIRLLGQSPFVVLSDPDEIKVLFQAPPDVLHPGEGAQILEPVVGPNSVILLDEAQHLEQRKLLLRVPRRGDAAPVRAHGRAGRAGGRLVAAG